VSLEWRKVSIGRMEPRGRSCSLDLSGDLVLGA
jgi:hypothetical protein